MFDQKLTPAKKLSKARTQLVMDDPFFGSISMRMIIRPDDQGILPYHTIATDGKQVIYNVDYIESLNVIETKSELAHEMGHVILKHQFRRGNRDFVLWNKACDQAVDHIINECPHITLAKQWQDNLDPAFKNKSAEEIYRIMKASQTSGQGGSKPDPNNPQPGSGQGGNQPNGQPPQPGNQPPPPPPPDNTKHGLPPKTKPGETQDPNIKPIPEANGTHGLILDAPINLKDKTQVQEGEEDIDIAIEQGAKLCGDLPGSLKTLVRSKKEHQVHYRELLREFLEKTLSLGDYDWMTPDRTYIQMDILIPGLAEEEDIPEIVFACDSSGSIGPAEKQAFAAEICGVLEEFPCTIKAIYCDTKVANVQDIDADDFPIELEFKGGGGTQFAPVFEYIKDHSLEPKAILYFTDLCSTSYGEDPGIPVLWMNTERGHDNKDVPFGQIIPLQLSEYEQGQLEFK
jgi:predicted metal-dependent peptidase